jgi:hypothetical protein
MPSSGVNPSHGIPSESEEYGTSGQPFLDKLRSPSSAGERSCQSLSEGALSTVLLSSSIAVLTIKCKTKPLAIAVRGKIAFLGYGKEAWLRSIVSFEVLRS